MERPYDKDIELLMGDLNVHSYIAHHYAQEQISASGGNSSNAGIL